MRAPCWQRPGSVTELFLDARLGETRAAVVDAGRLAEMHLVRADDGAPAGSRMVARLARKLDGRGIAILPDNEEAVIEPWPAGASEGADVPVEIVRAAWRETGRPRLAKARPAREAGDAASLSQRLQAAGHRLQRGWPDGLTPQWDAGWEAAVLARLSLADGSLGFSPTPALVAVDVDGNGPGLALAASAAAARAIRLWGIGGIVVIDFPAMPDRAARLAAAAAFDAAMGATPFERTAVNGFGLMQIVLPRAGPSILERARLQPEVNAALALLAAAQRETRPGALALVARPPVAVWLQGQTALLAELARLVGRRVDVRADAMAGDGYVETAIC